MVKERLSAAPQCAVSHQKNAKLCKVRGAWLTNLRKQYVHKEYGRVK